MINWRMWPWLYVWMSALKPGGVVPTVGIWTGGASGCRAAASWATAWARARPWPGTLTPEVCHEARLEDKTAHSYRFLKRKERVYRLTMEITVKNLVIVSHRSEGIKTVIQDLKTISIRPLRFWKLLSIQPLRFWSWLAIFSMPWARLTGANLAKASIEGAMGIRHRMVGAHSRAASTVCTRSAALCTTASVMSGSFPISVGQ